VTGNCRRQKKACVFPSKRRRYDHTRDQHRFRVCRYPEFDDCLLGSTMRSFSPEAHAIAGKVEPSSVHAAAPIHEEAHSTAFERLSSHRRRKRVSATVGNAVYPATLAAPFVFSNACLPASACVPSTPDAHGLFLARPHNVDINHLRA
jgi:hypothetical protein